MNVAVFFQQHQSSRVAYIVRKLYTLFFLRNDAAKIQYLRAAGAKVGDNVHIGRIEQVGTEPCLVSIGDNVYFSGSETQLITHDGAISHAYLMGVAPKRYDSFGRIKIGNNCFIGIRCIIMKGVTIGDNCIIGAGSVVTKDIPSGSVACGVPARVIESVSTYYNKHKDNLDDTIGWNMYKKRKYLEEKYQS